MVGRVKAGQNGCMRWQSERGAGDRVLEQEAAGGQRINGRSSGCFVSVAAEAVTPHGIQGDQQYIEAGGLTAAHQPAEVDIFCRTAIPF